MLDTNDWTEWVNTHTMNGDPVHDIVILTTRMSTVLDLQGAPDRGEVSRWITALDRIAYNASIPKRKKWYRR